MINLAVSLDPAQDERKLVRLTSSIFHGEERDIYEDPMFYGVLMSYNKVRRRSTKCGDDVSHP